MSALHIDEGRKHSRRTALIFLCISLFCGLFSAIYEHFSFGVYSNYMVYLFLFPLVGGVVPYTVLGLSRKLRLPSSAAARIYNSGIAALTVGSCVMGILEIYGTSSVYTRYYWIAGIALAGFGISMYLFKMHFGGMRKVGL